MVEVYGRSIWSKPRELNRADQCLATQNRADKNRADHNRAGHTFM